MPQMVSGKLTFDLAIKTIGHNILTVFSVCKYSLTAVRAFSGSQTLFQVEI